MTIDTPPADPAAATAAATTSINDNNKLTGPQLYDQLNRPLKIVAPMVDQSELAWRILSRRYGATLCYTPMMHARLFATDPKYRKEMFCFDLDGAPNDRGLVVQFCANDPQYLLQAAKLVENHCDAVDLNLGCPQGIAKKGNYGAFLMEDWSLIHNLINTLHLNLKVPVTAKIRVFPNFDKEKTLAYAKMVLNAGAQWLCVHGRTRDMKGQQTGIADWEIIKYLRQELPDKLVFFSNGNILYPEDIQRCMDFVGCDAVMSAEGNLYNPGVFMTDTNNVDEQFPRLDKIIREYFEIVKDVSSRGSNASKNAIKAHFFKLLRPMLGIETALRDKVAKTSIKYSIDKWEEIVVEVERIVGEIYQRENIKELDVVKNGEQEWWGGHYKEIPYWRCQPYFRKVDGKSVKDAVQNKQEVVLNSKKDKKKAKQTAKESAQENNDHVQEQPQQQQPQQNNKSSNSSENDAKRKAEQDILDNKKQQLEGVAKA